MRTSSLASTSRRSSPVGSVRSSRAQVVVFDPRAIWRCSPCQASRRRRSRSAPSCPSADPAVVAGFPGDGALRLGRPESARSSPRLGPISTANPGPPADLLAVHHGSAGQLGGPLLDPEGRAVGGLRPVVGGRDHRVRAHTRGGGAGAAAGVGGCRGDDRALPGLTAAAAPDYGRPLTAADPDCGCDRGRPLTTAAP